MYKIFDGSIFIIIFQNVFYLKMYQNIFFLIFKKLFLILAHQNDLKTLKIYQFEPKNK
jgi:hypothetical protein